MRELRRRAESAEARVEAFLEILPGVVDRLARDGDVRPGRGRNEVIEHAAKRGILAAYAVPLVAIESRDALDQVRERRHSIARLLREVSAAEEWREVIRRKEHREWPAAAALGQHLVRELVHLVEIRPFLAVHLDVDEQPVHHGGSRLVFERLVRHHMAPVTG